MTESEKQATFEGLKDPIRKSFESALGSAVTILSITEATGGGRRLGLGAEAAPFLGQDGAPGRRLGAMDINVDFEVDVPSDSSGAATVDPAVMEQKIQKVA